MSNQRNTHGMRAVILPLLVATCLVACEDSVEGQAAPPPQEVGVVHLKTQPVPVVATLPGRTRAYKVSQVRPQITGIIQERLFEEGAQVDAGQVLYTIDAAPYEAAHASASASLARAEATRDSAAVLAKRYAGLAKIEAVSQQENDDAQVALKEAEAAVAEARAAVTSARINLDYTHIEAPIAGKVATSEFTPGALVTRDQASPLTTVRQLDPIYVDITQPSRDLLELRRRFSAAADPDQRTVDVVLHLEDGSVYDHAGRLSFRGVAVEESTGTVKLRAIFPNPDQVLLPGMYVKAVLEQAVDDEGLLVPQQSITRDARGQASALVVKADNTVERRDVVTERAVRNHWVVTSGLSAGDRVIVDGLQRARPGATANPVRVDVEQTAMAVE